MNPTREAFLLSPYRPPTSYPVSLNPDEAAAWLSGFFALWHPAILCTLTQPPQAASSYDHDQPLEGAIYIVPEGPHLYQPDDWAERLQEAHALSTTATARREETQRLLLQILGEQQPENPLLHIPDAVATLFAAVGFGYLLVESLFDAMDHEHLLDAAGFWNDIQTAIAALTAQPSAGDSESMRTALRDAVEKLRAAREVLNTNSVHLLDFAILDSARLDGPWPSSLTLGLPLTVLASGELFEQLAQNHPERFAQLQQRLTEADAAPVDLACGSFREREDAVLPVESQWWNLTHGRAVVRNLFGQDTTIYGRTRSAYHPQLPGWLTQAGFTSAILVSFDGALTPSRNTAVLNWPSPDGKSVDAYGREPHNAADPLTFFNLVYHLQQSFSHDSAPTLAFAHRGEPAAIGYTEFVTLAGLGDPVGTFTNLRRYLEEYHYGEYLGAAAADDFFADYLDDRVTNRHRPDAVSGFARHHRLRRRLDAAFGLAALHRSLSPPQDQDLANGTQLEQLETAIETRGVDTDGVPTDEWAEPLQELETYFARRLADRIQVRSPAGQPGWLIFNPFGFTRRVALEYADVLGAVPVVDPVKAAERDGNRVRLVVEVPSFGYAWVPRPQSEGATPAPKARIKTAEGMCVRNEFFEAELDPRTGALRAFRDTRTRMNRLGMQLVFNPGSKMQATDVQVTNAGAALGEITAQGEILDDHDQVLATFRHRIRAWVGRPAIEVSLSFDVKHRPTGYPWHAYYGARFGWRDERAAIFRGVNGSGMISTYTRPVSPDYWESRLGRERTFVFTGGLPFVQKHGARMADVVLIPEGETGTEFELLLSGDRDYPMPTAVGWTAPVPVVATEKGPPPGGASGWLAALDLPSLLVTSLRPEQLPDAPTGARAVAARFIECSGFAGTAGFRFARDPQAAGLIDAEGNPQLVLGIEEGMIPLEFSANESFRLRVEWL
ncbi:MAG: hypothetical protein LC104_15265 [Bacteroidales bacterium]|nr:hypothetical protein [Bacteroidales bacterium]